MTKHSYNFNDLTGQIFTRLTVVRWSHKSAAGKTYWECQCSCGTLCQVSGSNLRTGHTKSCGCLHVELRGVQSITHGESRNKTPSPELRSFQTAKARCNNPNDAAFDRYGGRGIEFRFTSFTEFLKCVGRKPTPRHSLDRIDVNGHYEVGNVRWADDVTQGQNKRNNVVLVYGGEALVEAEWCRRVGLKTGGVTRRLAMGWCLACAVTLPKDSYCGHRPPPDRWTTRRQRALHAKT